MAIDDLQGGQVIDGFQIPRAEPDDLFIRLHRLTEAALLFIAGGDQLQGGKVMRIQTLHFFRHTDGGTGLIEDEIVLCDRQINARRRGVDLASLVIRHQCVLGLAQQILDGAVNHVAHGLMVINARHRFGPGKLGAGAAAQQQRQRQKKDFFHTNKCALY